MARTKDKEKPSQIIDAAFSAFGEIGYQATVIKDIADRAGISAGTIYTYFHGKRDLFRATAREGWRRFLDQVRVLAQSPMKSEDRLERLVDIGFGNLRYYLPLLRGMLFESSQMNILQESLDELCDLVERLIAGRREDQGTPAIDAARRRSLIRITVVGVMFSAALARPDSVEREIDGLKKTVALMLVGG